MKAQNNRIIVKFNGGLGNQMFQWAYARSICHKLNADMQFDMSFFKKRYARPFELDIFGLCPNEPVYMDKIKTDIIWRFRKHLQGKTFGGLYYYDEPHFEFDENLMKLPLNSYVTGFFQTENYFENIKEIIKKDFTFKQETDEKNIETTNLIQSSNSVSLHIRRGDYVQKKRYRKIYATCSLEYYKEAVNLISEKVNDIKLFIFSDDIPWVKENLQLPYDMIYVDYNSQKNSYKDMRLMSLCKHNIIANSSFSWWGAWLNNNPDKIVIAPQKWFNNSNINQNDIIPSNWIRIDNKKG